MTRYKVVGSTAFRGHKPGDLFDADLDPDLEHRATARGSIRVIRRDKHEHEEEETADAEADSTQ